MPEISENIAVPLLNWYKDHARDLPWRNTRDPYKIWLSEIILQQTSVAQGLSYYERFVQQFPTVFSLAAAEEDLVLKLWEGLGYYTRARNLHFTSKYIAEQCSGQFPDNYKDLLKLKGVGPYTAAAISSFAYNLPHVVVDGNVLRVFSRLFAIREAVDSPSTIKKIHALGQNLIHQCPPYYFNQAIMEFGAIQCVPRSPDCLSCPLKPYCKAYKKGLVAELPFKAKKIQKRKRYFQYTVLIDQHNKTYVHRRKNNDIWRGLYEFPMIETSSKDFETQQVHSELKQYAVSNAHSSQVYKQQLSHQTIYSKFYKLILEKGVFLRKHKDLQLIGIEKLNTLAFPKTCCLYLSDKSITLDK